MIKNRMVDKHAAASGPLVWLIMLIFSCWLAPVAYAVNADTNIAKLKKLTFAGPYAAVSYPLLRMVNSGALNDIAEEVSFVVWKDPDQMRALALNGQIDMIATPTNVAANLYNRGAKIRLLDVSIWGILWMVSREPDLTDITHYKGKEIAMPFRGDMPDIIFSKVATAAGMDVNKDFKLRYVASPLDAMQLLITRRVDHALLAEPAVSMALRKTQSFPVKLLAPDLYRSVDLQKEWGRLLKRDAKAPQAGIALLNMELSDHIIQRFNEEHRKAAQWCNDNPEEAGKMVAARIKMLMPEAVADALKISPLNVVAAQAAKPQLEYFFTTLEQTNPALIGGKLPNDAFYY